jgi:uncharacterized membrane protein
MVRIGRQVGGLAAAALGGLILWWGDFTVPWERVPVDPSLRATLAYATGVVMLLAGLGLFWLRTAKPAALILAAIAAVFSAFWVQKTAGAPAVYDSWGNIAEESSILAGYLALFACLSIPKTDNTARIALAARLWFGVCSISFGVTHFVYLKPCIGFVPSWVPGGGYFWSVFTGAAHVAAGLAILSGVWALLAARLAAIMYLGFGVIGWGRVVHALPQLHVTPPQLHFAWGGLIITFVLAAGAWMVGDAIATFPPKDGQLFLPRGLRTKD